MNTSRQYNDLSINGPAWDFLAEFPLNELLIDMDLRNSAEAGLLFQTVKGLGVRAELLDIIEGKLTVFASRAVAQLNQRRFKALTIVRLFCQKQAIADENLQKPAIRFKPEPGPNPSQVIHCSAPEINGGWGYFLVERGGSSQPESMPGTNNWIDLYLYKEGK